MTRHANASRAEVSIEQRPAELTVEVRDDGSTNSPEGLPSPGFGLRGMRERVEPLGGIVDYGPLPDGGWQVAATLPLGKART